MIVKYLNHFIEFLLTIYEEKKRLRARVLVAYISNTYEVWGKKKKKNHRIFANKYATGKT